MYLASYRRGRMGLIPAMQDREFIAPYAGQINTAARAGYPVPTLPVQRPPIMPVVEKPTPITVAPKPAPPMPGPMPRPTPYPIYPFPVPPIGVKPAPTPVPPIATAPPPAAANPNAGTPVPAGFPTNQIFVNSDGSFWEWSGSKWVNVGIPYGTGASATPAAAPPSSSGAPTTPTASTTAPVVNVTSPAPATSEYQSIIDFLSQDTLLAALGFSGIPNWLTGLGGAVLIYKVAAPAAAGRR